VESCPGVTYNPRLWFNLKFARSWQFENEKRGAKIDHRKRVLEMSTKSQTKTQPGYNAEYLEQRRR
jgi:hypothetical protein